MINNIEEIFNEGLCCNCGTCKGLCPKNAITLEINDKMGYYEPRVNKRLCNNCNLCLNVCPSLEVDFESLNLEIFGTKPDDIIIGNYLNCYIGYSKNKKIRYNASSGGIITALLIFALEKNMINGALVTRMKKNNPLEPEPFIARTKEEIIEASKSKYCPVPLNIMLKEILNLGKEAKLAIVGLPCHIHGIRKAEKLNKTLKEKIVLHLGIFCSHTDNFWQTEYLIKKLNIKRNEIAEIMYRGSGWPGNMSIQLKNTNEVNLSYDKAMIPHKLWINSLFRCLFCCDLTAELADISCGDPWLPEIIKTEKLGQDIIISRTETAEKLLSVASSIKIDKINIENVKIAGSGMESKKKDILVRLFIRQIFNSNVPRYNANFLKPGIKSFIKGYITYQNSFLSSKVYLRGFIFILTEIGWFFFKRTVGNNVKDNK